MEETSPLIQDLALILITAGIVTLIFKRLKQPLVLGYIMAGFIVSPNFKLTMSIVDENDIETWSNIGVMFLLFALGLDFSFKKILKMGMAPIIASLTIVFLMMVTGFCIGTSMGWSEMNSLFLAGMLSMSSTTIIYKAFSDLGLQQQQFSSLVMSVLILEDILAIVMMVILGAIATGNSPDGLQLASSVLMIGFFIILWFVVGLFMIPTFLRKVRKLINDEVLLIVSLGLCCAMALFATGVGFSSAFGAFVMGSILAETVEAKKIEKVVKPVKDLFGAIFFVSVGMLVDADVVVDQWLSVVIITLAIIIGQSIFGTFGFMLSGQSLKTAMQCGFSMAQIGEFAFIIASLGLSLGVIEDYVYPIVVTVSVITTFLTPYMIRGAVPLYKQIEARLPKVWIRRINKVTDITPSSDETATRNQWRSLITHMVLNTIIHSCLCAAIVTVMLTFVKPFLQDIVSAQYADWSAIFCGIITIICMSPFLRAMIMKKNKSEEFEALWTSSRHNRAPLVFTIFARVMIALMFIFYVCSSMTHYSSAIIICLALLMVYLMVISKSLKLTSIRLERLFIQNLRSKDYAARATGKQRPLYEGRLLDRDLHISTVEVPQESLWAGKTLKELNLRKNYNVHVSSIIRGQKRLNIPSGDDIIFPLDQLEVIGTDTQLTQLNSALQGAVPQEPEDFYGKDMQLKRFLITNKSPFLGKSLSESQLRDKYNCMLVGIEEGEGSLKEINPAYKFELGDLLWIVGEENNIYKLSNVI